MAQAGAISALPQLMAGAAPAKPRAVPPSERIILGGIGIGNRGSYDLAASWNNRTYSSWPSAT